MRSVRAFLKWILKGISPKSSRTILRICWAVFSIIFIIKMAPRPPPDPKSAFVPGFLGCSMGLFCRHSCKVKPLKISEDLSVWFLRCPRRPWTIIGHQKARNKPFRNKFWAFVCMFWHLMDNYKHFQCNSLFKLAHWYYFLLINITFGELTAFSFNGIFC